MRSDQDKTKSNENYHHSLCRRGSRGPCGVGLPLDIDEVGAKPVENVVQQTEHLDVI